MSSGHTKYTEFSIKFLWKFIIGKRWFTLEITYKDKKSRHRMQESNWGEDIDVVK